MEPQRAATEAGLNFDLVMDSGMKMVGRQEADKDTLLVVEHDQGDLGADRQNDVSEHEGLPCHLREEQALEHMMHHEDLLEGLPVALPAEENSKDAKMGLLPRPPEVTSYTETSLEWGDGSVDGSFSAFDGTNSEATEAPCSSHEDKFAKRIRDGEDLMKVIGDKFGYNTEPVQVLRQQLAGLHRGEVQVGMDGYVANVGTIRRKHRKHSSRG